MNGTTCAAALVAAALLAASPAEAQISPSIVLAPAEPSRVDVSGRVGWFGGNKSHVGADWDDWYNAATAGAAIGYYITSNLKAEIDAGFSAEGHVYVQEPIPIPGAPFPVFRSREHYFRTQKIGAGVSYQFFENQWFHPFVGAGIDAVRERNRIVAQPVFLPSPDPRASSSFAPGEPERLDVSYSAQPFVTAGLKWYVSPRAFLRSDLRTALSHRGVADVAWTAGIGVDL